MRRRTRSDLPEPGAPSINMPASPSATQLAWRVTRSAIGLDPSLRNGRNAHDETGAENRALAAGGRLAITVLGPDAALMRLDDLARDRQTEAGILAEGAFRTIGVEALEDAFEILGRNARPLILDAELDVILQAP